MKVDTILVKVVYFLTFSTLELILLQHLREYQNNVTVWKYSPDSQEKHVGEVLCIFVKVISFM